MKQKFLLLLALACSYMAMPQTAYYELNSNLTGIGRTFIARDSISLKQDFEYSSSTGLSFLGTIDDDQVLEESYLSEPIDPATRELNTDYAVGSINGSFNVTPTGAASYNIPIAVPPGTAGVQPNLSVGYSSQGGNGLMGMGWNLAGLSMITRTGTTIYHDGFIDGVDFDGNDRYVWDGQRLFNLGCTTGTDTLYGTESESFARIVSTGTSGNGPLYWTVWTKDGTRFEYGTTGNSRHQEQNSASVIRWMLDKVIDRQGNYMQYYYNEDQAKGTWRIDSIMYTGNASASPALTPYNKVKFYYSTRSDSAVAYVGGSCIKNNLLLRKIRTFAEGDFAHEYRFRYYYDDFTSHLNEIIEVGYNGERLNSTVVGWGEESAFFEDEISEIDYTFCLGELNCYYLKQIVPGDYNSDGVDDAFLVYKSKENQINTVYILKWYDFTNEVLYDLETISNNGCLGLSFSKADFNGDGYDDLLRLWTQDSSPDWTGVDLYMNDATGDANPFDWKQNNGAIQNVSVDDSPRFYAVDLDGNGKSEVLKFYYDRLDTQKYIAELYKITGFSSPFSAMLLDTLQFDNTNLFSPYEILDFNGNGKAEVIHVKNISPTKQFKSYEYNTTLGEFETIFDGGFPTESHKRYFADFNGDGKTDVLTYHPEHKWELHYSDGVGWVEVDCPVGSWYDPTNSFYNIFTADVNGDGKGDIIQIYPLEYNDVVRVCFCNGDSFTINTTLIDKNYIELNDNITFYGDFNGDGGNEFLFDPWNLSIENLFIKLSFHPNDESNLVTKISNGLNQQIEIDYRRLTFDNPFYLRGTAQAYPLGEYCGPLPAVKTVKSDMGDLAQSMESTNYNYSSLKLHKQGKGLLGMTRFTSININSNKVIANISEFDFNNTYYFPMLRVQDVRLGQQYTLVSSVDYAYETTAVGGSGSLRYLNLPNTVISTGHLQNNTVTTEYDYDSYGNVSESIVTHENDGTPEGVVTTAITYTGATGNPANCDYLPNYITVTKERPGESDVSVIAYNDYLNGLLIEIIRFRFTPMEVAESFTHDDFGNVLSATVSAYGLNSRENSLTYDSKGRFPITKENALEWEETFEYDHRTGQPLKHTDVNNLVTRYKYDGFGRTKLVEYPDGLNMLESLHWDDGNGPDNACYYSQSQSSGMPAVKTWYDRVGRGLKTQSTAFDGRLVNSKTEYDALGRPYRSWEPSYDGISPVLYTEYQYDDLGRNHRTTLPTGVTLISDYSGLASNQISTYREHNSIQWDTVTKTMNAYGEPLTIADIGGTIFYDYNSLGLTTGITSNGSTITMEYDAHGNRTS
nr:hypothetical protein [Bacteroidota bacterium]